MSVLLNSIHDLEFAYLHTSWSKKLIQNLHFVLLPPMARCRGETPLRLILLKNAFITPIWVLLFQTKPINKEEFHLISLMHL
jgi:hypothetical protein